MKLVSADLLASCIKGKRRAQSELYRLCYEDLLNICFRYRLSRDEAVILLNESFFKILNGLKKKKENVPFEFWAKRVCINHCISVMRYEARHSELYFTKDEQELDLLSDDPFEVEEKHEYSDEEKRNMQEALGSLPKATHEVFQLFVFEDYSHKEIGELLDISEGTSKWHIHKARQLLKAALKKGFRNILSLML